MVKLVLVNYGTWAYPPLGLGYIAAYLRKYLNFNNISIVEGENNIVEKIATDKPDIVGFTTTSIQYSNVLKLANDVKNYLDVYTIIGGPHITALPHILPETFDIGVIGEGEDTMLELMQLFLDEHEFNKKKLEKVRGISFHNGDKVITNPRRRLIEPLDVIPYPARDLFDMKRYLQPSDILSNRQLLRGTTILTSRGCPYRCVYCQASHQWQKVRYHSPEYVVNEMKSIVETYNVEAINIVDDFCMGNIARLRGIVSLVREEGLHKKVKFNINGRANLVNDEIFKLLKSMNVVQVAIGFESGSEKILRYLKRGTVTVQQNEDVFRLAKKYDIPIGGQFMLGNPGESRDDLMKTFEFIKKHRMSHINLNITTPLPGTELWEFAKKMGLVSENMDWSKMRIGYTPNLEENIYICDKMSKSEFLSIYKQIVDYRETVDVYPITRYMHPSSISWLISTFRQRPKKAVKILYNSIKRFVNI